MSLDDYTKSRVIGKGSYGEVWLVKHKRDKKQYVLKKMSLQKASKRERKAAEQEAKLLAKLKHPNIVSYKDSFETDDGFLYIAMGYCEGGDLYNRLKEQKNAPLEETQVVEWFVQIAMALQYMHERNILHRDLKTQNIFLTKSKIIKVGDLGIARVLDNSSDMATTLIGTPYYMSPELFSNKPYNHKSDVWALGCCVYEMATLRHAFNAKDMNSLVYKILRGKMPMMPRQYGGDLVNLIKAMLNANPDRRPNVNRILRDPYIKKNIALFLEGTRKKVNNSKRSQSTSSDEGQISSRSSVSSVSSVGNVVKVYSQSKAAPSGSGDNKGLEPLHVGPNLDPIQEEKTPRVNEGKSPKNVPESQKPSVPKPISSAPKNKPSVSPKRNTPEKSKNSLAPDLPPSGRGSSPNRQLVNRNNRRNRKPRSNKSVEVEVESVERSRERRYSSSSASSASSSSSVPGKSVFRNPKKVDQPRPLPPGPPPSGGDDAMPVSSRSRRGGEPDSGYRSHESSTHSQDPTDGDTPRVRDQQQSVNKSARARRREKVELETPRTARSVDIERPSSARSSSDRRNMELEAGGDRPSRPNSARSTPSAVRLVELEAAGDRPARPCSASSARSVPAGAKHHKTEFKSQPSMDEESSDEAEEVQNNVQRRPVKRNPTVRMQCPPEQKLSPNKQQQDMQDYRKDSSNDNQDAPTVLHYVPDQPNPRPGWPVRRDPRSGVLIPDYQSDPFRNNSRTDYVMGQAKSQYNVDILKINRQPRTDSMIVSVGDYEEEDLEDDERENSGQHKEMNNFITLLDHTLNLKKDEKSDEDSEGKNLDEIAEEDEDESQSKRPKTGGSVTYAVKNPKVVKAAGDVDMPDFDPRPRHKNPAKALGSSTRLMDRIGALRKDCIRGLGVVKLKKAYDILDNIEGDELENALVELLGRDDFEIYAGKIWQLKFCEEAAFGISS